ncbi:MAG: hypothetical protein F9K35_00660 [Burkholderiaceae bacterium]|nr:MAG: hypothetical protein F9K35_00660 [Burkholderiaceae bacterium]
MSYYIDPIAMTSAQLLSSSLAEDPTPAWVTGTNYPVGTEVHVPATHRVYKDAKGGASATSPELDPTRWQDMRPTNLWAPFDEYTDTAAWSTAGDITYVLASRFVNALVVYGLAGAGVSVTIKDAPGGAVIYRYPTGGGVARLKRAATGYYDYAYGQRKDSNTLLLNNLPIRANAEITITVTGGAGQRRAIGMIVRGKLRDLVGIGSGGVEQDAEVNPKTYTTRETQPDGRQRVVVRGSSKDLSMTIQLERKNADAAVQALTDLLSRPVAWFASIAPGFQGLSVFGVAQRSPVRYRNNTATITLTVEGLV